MYTYMQTHMHLMVKQDNTKNALTYTSGPITAAQFKQVGVFEPQAGVHQHVQTGKLTL